MARFLGEILERKTKKKKETETNGSFSKVEAEKGAFCKKPWPPSRPIKLQLNYKCKFPDLIKKLYPYSTILSCAYAVVYISQYCD